MHIELIINLIKITESLVKTYIVKVRTKIIKVLY